MSEYKQSIIGAMYLLTAFVALGIGAVALTYFITAPKIAYQENQKLLRDLNEIIPSDRYNNDFARDTLKLNDAQLGNNPPYQAFRARKDNAPQAVVIQAETKLSYSGTPIQFLVGINYDGTVAGVRVITHKETPGLGDAIMSDRSDWALSFNGTRLGNPTEEKWTVKKDGGEFDQFTGATITPRAVVHGVRDVLLFYKQNRDTLFKPASHPNSQANAS